jgi:hypothetical protein
VWKETCKSSKQALDQLGVLSALGPVDVTVLMKKASSLVLDKPSYIHADSYLFRSPWLVVYILIHSVQPLITPHRPVLRRQRLVSALPMEKKIRLPFPLVISCNLGRPFAQRVIRSFFVGLHQHGLTSSPSHSCNGSFRTCDWHIRNLRVICAD